MQLLNHKSFKVDIKELSKNISCTKCDFTCSLNIQLKKHEKIAHINDTEIVGRLKCELMSNFSAEFERLNNSIKEVADTLEITVDKLRKDNNEKCKTLAKTMRSFYKKMNQVEVTVANRSDEMNKKGQSSDKIILEDAHDIPSLHCQHCGITAKNENDLQEHNIQFHTNTVILHTLAKQVDDVYDGLTQTEPFQKSTLDLLNKIISSQNEVKQELFVVRTNQMSSPKVTTEKKEQKDKEDKKSDTDKKKEKGNKEKKGDNDNQAKQFISYSSAVSSTKSKDIKTSEKDSHHAVHHPSTEKQRGRRHENFSYGYRSRREFRPRQHRSYPAARSHENRFPHYEPYSPQYSTPRHLPRYDEHHSRQYNLPRYQEHFYTSPSRHSQRHFDYIKRSHFDLPIYNRFAPLGNY